jgi:phosphatidylglycerophosphate synthase
VTGDRLLDEWSSRHGDYDVDRSLLVKWWLRGIHSVARPLAGIGLPPDALTAAGVVCAVAAATAPRRRAAALVVATAVFDGLDGAVAVRRGRPSSYGAGLDRLADRVTDCCFALALSRAGARRSVVFSGLLGTAALEALRFLEAHQGAPVRVVTPGERPLRVVYTVIGLAVAPTAGATAVAATTVIGVGMLRRGRPRERPTARTLDVESDTSRPGGVRFPSQSSAAKLAD